MNLSIITEQVLNTPRLFLEPLIINHAEALYKQLLDEKLYKFIPQEPPVSLQALQKRYGALSSRISPDEREIWLNWVMRIRETNIYVGTLEATVYSDFTAKIAYMVFSQFWQQKFAKEGCECMLNYLSKNFSIKRVVIEMDTRNIASIRLAKSLGFKCISTKFDADFFKGTTSHEYLYEREL
jgi:[ribosomal protein S5]-alanine N-acetyltransferase